MPLRRKIELLIKRVFLVQTFFVLYASSVAIAAEVGALGYIAPKDKIIYLVGTPNVEIASIKVDKHQRVQQGQVLMEFSNLSELNTRLKLAKLELNNQIALGPERIKMQEIQLSEAQRALKHAQAQLKNYTALSAKTQVATELSRRKQTVENAQYQLDLNRLKLNQVKRESDLATEEAKLQLQLAKAQSEKGRLLAPRSGIILDIRKQVGETIGGEPAILLADVSATYAVCDVYESDLLKIKPGMKAVVSSNSLPDDISATVERVDQVVDTDSRLGKVLLKLDETKWSAQLIGLEVHIVINL